MKASKKQLPKLHGNRTVRLFVDGRYIGTDTWGGALRRTGQHALASYRLLDVELDPPDTPIVRLESVKATR